MKVEIPSKRTLRGKVFDIGGGKRKCEISTDKMVHTPDDFDAYRNGRPHGWEDIDIGWDDDTQVGEYKLRNHWMRLRVAQNHVGWKYQSRMTGAIVQAELMRLDGRTFNPDPPVFINGSWTWVDVVPGLDIFLRVMAGNVKPIRILKGPQAPHKFTWKITESNPGSLPIQFESVGHDNYGEVNPEREGTGPGRIRRPVIMEDPVVTDMGGGITGFVEEWTGQVINRDEDRVPFPTTDFVYPVMIDPAIPQESIGADGDDGHVDDDGTPTWHNEYNSTGNHILFNYNASRGYFPGWRFLGIPDIASGDTIDSATITLELGGSSGTAQPTVTVYGSDEDSATAWSDSHHPRNMTQTTANAPFGGWGSGFANTQRIITVTTIVAEIVARGGWSAGNDMAFGTDFTPENGSDVQYIGDYAGGGDVGALLDITYTAAAAGGTHQGPLTRVLNGALAGPIG